MDESTLKRLTELKEKRGAIEVSWLKSAAGKLLPTSRRGEILEVTSDGIRLNHVDDFISSPSFQRITHGSEMIFDIHDFIGGERA